MGLDTEDLKVVMVVLLLVMLVVILVVLLVVLVVLLVVLVVLLVMLVVLLVVLVDFLVVHHGGAGGANNGPQVRHPAAGRVRGLGDGGGHACRRLPRPQVPPPAPCSC